MEEKSKGVETRRFLKPLCQCDPTAEFKYEPVTPQKPDGRFYIIYRHSPMHPWRKMLNERRRPLWLHFDSEKVMPLGFDVHQVAPGVFIAFAAFIDYEPLESPPGGAG